MFTDDTNFNDDYGVSCSLQNSSAWEPHVWLGVNEPKHKVLFSDVTKIGKLNIAMPVGEQNGWCDVVLPKEVHVFSRMHLNQARARELAKRLMYFADHGYLPNTAICECYHIENDHGVCYGTKERETCDCDGNIGRCNFPC